MNSKSTQLLKLSFIIGTIADGLVAINWFLIAFGVKIPNLLCGLKGSGIDYQFAMYIAAIFMASWTGILFWGWFKPHERKGLLLIAAMLLFASIIIEVLFFQNILKGTGFLIGITLRLVLIAKFSASYFYSIKGAARTPIK
ncbi:MAG: hypothetical protein GY940_25180 [bacterium]|nr:hypothetical protein [bacterium]